MISARKKQTYYTKLCIFEVYAYAYIYVCSYAVSEVSICFYSEQRVEIFFDEVKLYSPLGSKLS